MRAFVARSAGATTVEAADVPVPRIGYDELLVRIHAVGVGIHDSYFLPAEARYPFVAGIEAAGVVEQLGSQVSGYDVGDRIGLVSFGQLKGGTWAEYAAVDAGVLIVPIPDGMDFTQAAAIPVAGNTALRVFHALSGMAGGASLFIAGGSGAIGTLAIQLARQRGWRVAASASTANHEYMLGLGADLAVDYRDVHWPEQVRQWARGGVGHDVDGGVGSGVDGAVGGGVGSGVGSGVGGGVDAAIGINPGTAADSMTVVRDGGVVVAVSGDDVKPERGIQISGISHEADVRDELAQLTADIAAGRLHLEIGKVYPFAEAPAALAQVQTRHARGKLVLQLPD